MSHALNSFENPPSERAVGVKVGDWFEYKLTSFLNTSNHGRSWPEVWGPQEIVEGRIEVQGVLGTNVTLIVSARTMDGAWTNVSQWIDVRTGQSDPPNSFIVIAANLSAVSVYENPAFENVVINYTTTGYYGENFRNVNVVLLESPTVQYFGGIPYTRFESRWDKLTGMKVEGTYRIDDVQNETNYYHAELRIQLTRTNAWPKKEWKVGVNVGDWWKYGNITLNLNSSDPNATPPTFQPFFLANETDWQTFNVTEVSGRNVTLKIIVHFKNQTEIVEEIHGDIANNTSLIFVLIASNLSIQEPFLIDGAPIMSEKVYNCIGVPRRAVTFNISQQSNSADGTEDVFIEFTWDKFTGILLDLYEQFYVTNGSAYYKLDLHMNIVETNLWGLQAHVIKAAGQQFTVTTFSNASISNMALKIEEKALIFNLTGFEGTIGYCNITVPKTLVSCDLNSGWQLYIDGNPITDFLIADNDTHTSIHFTHTLSSHQVKLVGQQIIPELPSWHGWLLLIITISIAIALRKIVKSARKSSWRSLRSQAQEQG
jgi:hypothetical protein